MTAGPHAAAARRAWDRLATDHPELAPAAAFQRRAWERLAAAAPTAVEAQATAADVRARFEAGVPLLAAARLRFVEPVPWDLLHDLARESARAFASADARAIARAAKRRAAPLERALDAALRRDDGALEPRAAELGVSAAALRTLADLAVSVTLQKLAEASAGALASAPWSHGFCPLCGAWPVFGELRDADRSRYLRCGLCAADWPFPRLQCPYCAETDHRRLRALHVEGEVEFRRAELCDACHGYSKTLARLAPTPAALLPVEDLATAFLDLLALDAGYARPAAPPSFDSAARHSAA